MAQTTNFGIPHVPDELYVKFKYLEEGRSSANRVSGSGPHVNDVNKSELSSIFGVVEAHALFKPVTPGARHIPSKYVNNLYRIKLGNDDQLENVLQSLRAYDNVIYAEPVYFDYALQGETRPNDPQSINEATQKLQLEKIEAFKAWEIQKGDPSIVIGIIDEGTEFTHEDLRANHWTNLNENGQNEIDDDGNGYIDDFNGYDIADDDSDPKNSQSDHGTMVAGIAAATTNNGTGIAGIGYNSRFLAVKIFPDGSKVSKNAYEGVLYAAQTGAKVLNLSWGSNGTFLQSRQDLINHIVLERGVVVVAAAGNAAREEDPKEADFYPASYDNVLSVGATYLSDHRAIGSVLSYKTDISALGQDVYTTKNGGNRYGGSGFGTSFASPLVAGAAALLCAEFPDFSAVQIMEQLRVTSDDTIYQVGNNTTFEGQLGHGRLNIYSALTEVSSSVRMLNVHSTGFDDDHIFHGDTINITGDFQNYLKATKNLQVSLTTKSPYVVALKSKFNIGSLSTMAKRTSDVPFGFRLLNNTPPDEKIVFKIQFEDDDYHDLQYFAVKTAPPYLKIETEKLGLTIGGNGNLAYNDDAKQDGVGLLFNSSKILDNIGLIIASHPDSVFDNALIDARLGNRDQDFTTDQHIRYNHYSGASTYMNSMFATNGNGSRQYVVEQKAFGWNSKEDANFVILSYRLTNNSATETDSIRLGLLADFELGNPTQNFARFDNDLDFGYLGDTSNEYFAGVGLLDGDSLIYNAIFTTKEQDEFVTFDDREKFDLCFQEITKTRPQPRDLGSIVSALIGKLGPYESKKVAFVLAAASSDSLIRASVRQARFRYQQVLQNPPIIQYDSTCESNVIEAQFPDADQIIVFNDPFGQNEVFRGEVFRSDTLEKDTILFVKGVDSLLTTDIYSLPIIVGDPKVEMQLTPNTLYIDDQPKNAVQFDDQTRNAVQWKWNFGNGFLSSRKNAVIEYREPGQYEIALSVKDHIGCENSDTLILKVLKRSPKPQVPSMKICQGKSATIKSIDDNIIRVFADSLRSILVGEGKEVVTGPIIMDSIFYVANIDSVVESHLVKAKVNVVGSSDSIMFNVDTLSLTTKSMKFGINTSAQTYLWKFGANHTSTEPNPTFSPDLQLSEFGVSVTFSTNDGCSSTLFRNIRLEKSSKLSISDTTICFGQDQQIKMVNGDIIYFYNDETMSSVLFKGSGTLIKNIQRDTVLYLTNATNFIESDLATVRVSVFDYNPSIRINPPVLDLKRERNVQFSSSSSQTSVFNWYLDSVYADNSAKPKLSIAEEGSYWVSLKSVSRDGCADSTVATFRAFFDEVTYSKQDDELKITINQNNTGLLSIRSYERLMGYIQIADLTGKSIWSENVVDNNVEVKGLKSGLYFVMIQSGDDVFSQKVLIY